jgi:uncharacterized protein
MRIRNLTKNTILAEDAEIAASFSQRTRGLLGRDSLPLGKGMHILRCNSVHTFFMRFSIDVVFLSAHGKVLKTFVALKPFRITLPLFRASSVIELPAGTVLNSNTEIDDTIAIE